MSADNNAIELKHFEVCPDLNVKYLDEDARIDMEFKNNSDSVITIKKIICSYQVTDNLPKYEIVKETPIEIQPGCISKNLEMKLEINLRLQPATNRSTLKVIFDINGVSKTITFDNQETKYIIINDRRSPGHKFFLSYKDPENKDMAEKLNHYLKKIGFKGYIAIENRKPGMDIWKEKIFPSIDDSAGLIVLWTSEAAKSQDSILREIKYARKKKKTIIFAKEKNIPLPDNIKKTIEYQEIENKKDSQWIINMVEAIREQYQQGTL